MAVLYSLAAITPDTEFGLSFYDYFTEEERFALWRVANLREYLPKMNSAPSRGLSIDMAKPLMRSCSAVRRRPSTAARSVQRSASGTAKTRCR